ncbi:MAG: hypothetical protein K6G03_02140 [Lachnospiraceae bacterium]|nr:hypothetical protein [Lachnospiraceae bacterium]
MADKEIKKDIVIDEKDIKISDADPIKYTADLNSPIATKVKKIEEEALKKKELEERRSERIRLQQDYLNSLLENVTDNLSATDKEKQINDALEHDVRKQVLSMHGISEDKYEGMERRSAAINQGSESAIFLMSLILLLLSAFISRTLKGPVDVTLFICFMTAVEGTLLNHGARSKAIVWILRVVYYMLFPMMLIVFIMAILQISIFIQTMSIFAVFGVAVLLMGVIPYFIYNPYREEKKQLKQAHKYLKNMNKAAEREVTQNIKKEEKEIKKEEKEKQKLLRKEERQAKKDEIKRQKALKKEKPGTTETVDKTETDETNETNKTDGSEGSAEKSEVNEKAETNDKTETNGKPETNDQTETDIKTENDKSN